MSDVPSNVVNKSLYRSIKNKLRARIARNNQRWGAYTSGQLVSEYKRRGGKYSGVKSIKRNSGNLGRWYKEKWVNVCNWPRRTPCGRTSFSKKNFPYCRPSVRVNPSTPKTVQELTAEQRKRLCQRKRKTPRKIIRQ